MNTTSIEEMIRVMAASQEGKAIQGRSTHAAQKDPNTPWEDLPIPLWNWQATQYRIKPEPHVLWVLRDDHGRFGGVFLEKSKAAEQAEYVENAKIVKYVEELEMEIS